MKPIFILNGHDYTKYLDFDGLKTSRNDLDSEGSGRNILDGLMYRSRISTKGKWTVTFNRLDEDVMQQLMSDMYSTENYINIKLLDSRQKRYITRTYYCSTINEGVQRYIGGRTVYDGVTFNITER